MSVINRMGGYGQVVAGAAKALPQTAAGNIFTVAGGPILLTQLFGLVVTNLGATVTTLSVGTSPTGGAASGVSLATAVAITSKQQGCFLTVPETAGGALVVTDGISLAAGLPQDAGGLALIAPGAITVTTSANDTGTVQWYLGFVPFPGANVAAV